VTADPRVEAVADALWKDDACGNTRDHYRALAVVAVAALDAHDAGHDLGLMVQRERIALDIDHLWTVKADEFGRHHDSYQEGYLDGIEHAARIARGQA